LPGERLEHVLHLVEPANEGDREQAHQRAQHEERGQPPRLDEIEVGRLEGWDVEGGAGAQKQATDIGRERRRRRQEHQAAGVDRDQ
jgi:hypothetical protein